MKRVTISTARTGRPPVCVVLAVLATGALCCRLSGAERAAHLRMSQADYEDRIHAVWAGQVIGMLHVEASRHGYGELGMLVDRAWRGRGVGSALLAAAADWARDQGLHKLCLEVFAHNAAAIAAYRKAGYAEEGRRVAQYRRVSGERWDTIVMGLLL